MTKIVWDAVVAFNGKAVPVSMCCSPKLFKLLAEPIKTQS